MVLTNLENLPSHDVVIYTMMFLSVKIVLYGRYFKFLGGRKMKRLTKRVFTAVMACLISCLMFATPVLAATNCFSKTTVKLNAINGGTSRYGSITSGSVSGSSPSITKLELYCNVASGTDPYTIYVESPDGTIISIPGPTRSGSITIPVFEGENPSGTWTIWIQNDGVSYNGNIYPASTATFTLKICYSY